MKNKSPVLRRLYEYGVITLGCAIYALSFNWFFQPNNISMGGFTGIAQIINHFLPVLPIGVTSIVMNIPLFYLGVRRQGVKLLVSSLYAMSVGSLMLDGMAAVYTFSPMEEPLLACIYGGVLLGVSMGWYPVVEAVFKPVIEFLRPIPPIAWIPISILWYGFSEMSKYFLIFLASFFVIVISVYSGVQSVDTMLIRAAKMLGAKDNQLFSTIIIPSVVPYIFSGLQVALGNSWAATVRINGDREVDVPGLWQNAPSGLVPILSSLQTMLSEN